MDMTTPEISVKTEVDFDFINDYNGDELTENSQGSQCEERLQRATCNNTTTTATMAALQQQPPVEDDDAKLRKLLKQFDLEILFTLLKLHDITYRSLKYLTTDDINAAIRHLGYRAEFREKLFTWRRIKLESVDNSAPAPTMATPATTVTISSGHKKPANTIIASAIPMQMQYHNATGAPSTTTSTIATTPLPTVTSIAAATVVPTTTSAPATIIKRNAPEDFLSFLPGVSRATGRLTSNISAVLLEPSSLHLRQPLNFMPPTGKAAAIATMPLAQQQPVLGTQSGAVSSCSDDGSGDGGYLPKGVLTMSSGKVHVQNVLESTSTGRFIKQFYNKNGFLEDPQRNGLVRLIIEAVMQQGVSLSPKDFHGILNDIVTVFPNEKTATDYYFIYRSGKGNPLGRLYQRYSNEKCKRRKLTRLAHDEGDCSDGDPHSSLLDEDDTMSTYPQELPGRVPRIDEMTALALKQLLTTDHFSWEEVCDKWIQTWALRQKELQQSGLAELLSNWAKLADPRAAELYKIDFRHVFPNKEHLLLTKWDEYVKKVSPQLDKKLNHDDMKKLYKYCKMGMASKDEKDFVYAVGLTALLPSTGRFKDHTGKLKIRANISDSIDSFVMRLNTLEAYESRLELYNRKFGPINRSVHPFLVVIMPNECTISKIYVALENHFYCMQSFLQALDLCYKIYHTCGLKYPTICENVWTFVQRYFYGMTVPWEARSANLVSLMDSLTVQN